MAILQDILSPSVVRGIVTRVQSAGDVLSRFFGLQIGASMPQIIGRQYSYDIFDYTRQAATGRRPGTQAANRAPMPVANQKVTIPRQFEKVSLNYELLNHIRQLGESAGTRDRMGTQYIEKQATEAKRYFSNFREVMLAALLRQGTLYFRYDGDDMIPCFTAPTYGETIDWSIPAGNKTTLDMLGAGAILGTSWDNVAAPIPHDIFQIDEAFQALTGQPLAHVWCSTAVWLNVLKNTDVRNMAGSSNKPYAEFAMSGDTNSDGYKTSLYTATLPWCPHVQWHVYNGGLEVDDGTSAATYTKFFADTKATFHIEKGPWLQGVEGSEPRKVNVLAPAEDAVGFDSYVCEEINPPRYELYNLQNFFLEMNTPKALAIGTVVF